jgi:hypothetical protein
MEETPARRARIIVWLKRIGVVGFLFFLAKGLLWLSLPTLLIWWGVNN